MNTYQFAQMPSNSSVATLVSFVVSAWFLVAAGAMLAEPSVGEQARALQAKTPVVTVRQLSAASENAQPEVRFVVEVAAKRGGRVS
jgi:hypothetical protein